MGLDMYLTGRMFFWHASKPGAERRESGKRVKSIDVELGYWRKHPDLHGHIVQTYMEGKDECQEIELSVDNLHNIISAIQERRLPKTSGFFFGESEKTREQNESDIKKLMGAIKWLEGGDDWPVTLEKVTEFATVVATAIKSKPAEESQGGQQVSRSVHYQADW